MSLLLPLGLAWRATAPAQGVTPILTTSGPSLTTMKVTSATNVQDVRLRAGQRGVNLDGSLRAAAHQRMAIEGNPFEDVWSAPTVSGVRLDLGTYQVSDVDIALPAEGFSWVIGRTYNARQETSGGSHRDSQGFQGKNWFQTSQPEILLYEDGEDAADDLVYLFYGADRYVEYKRAGTTSSTFQSRNGAAGVWEHTDATGSEPETYTLTDQHGNELTFFGFDANAGAAAGQLWKIEDPAGNVAFVGDATTGSTAISNGFNASGYITTAYDSSDRRYTYTYTTLDSVLRLTEVKAETKTGGDWSNPTGVATVAKVEYAYYTDESYGDPGDLKLVTVTEHLTDSGVTATKKKYFRYWEGTFDASTNPGHPHALKYVVDFEGTRSQDWEDSTFDEDFLTLSNANLEPYAAAFFEYDSEHRISEAWFNGDCGCSGGVNGTHYFEYEANGSFSDTPEAYDTDWKTRTIVQRPDGSFLTQYFDEVGQALHRVVTDASPDITSPAPSRWLTKVVRDSSGRITDLHTPSNITGYTHSSASITTSTTDGLVFTYVRRPTGELRGFVTEKKWKEGTSGTAYYEGEWDYASGSLTISDSTLYRPVRTKIHRYAAVSTSTTDRITTSFTNTFYSGEVALEKVETTHPAVATANNGSGTANTTTRYFRKDGTVSFVEAEDGIIGYREYTDGRLTKSIEDADTGQTGVGEDFENVTIPTGLSSTSGAVHRRTTYTYDAQGRRETTDHPDGRVVKSYYSRLADHRLVALTYNDYEASPTETFYGPVSYRVTNHAGNAEVQATVALASNQSTTAQTGHLDETDADPITAMDLGTVAKLTTNVYDATGNKLEETRLYFDVPSSGAGTDGTHYDPTKFGYDDQGRRWRVKEASGTIYRTVFDIHGRTTERWIGTNDSTFEGGEASGTDDMVKTHAFEYDSGADDGNGYLTKRTGFVEDSTTDQRVTTFTNDVRGRALLEARPTAPHAFHEYDNMGRRTWTGLYSSTASIDVSTDRPSTEATNRLALSQTEFDEMGRVWKTVRHEIDPADGSDDDNLESLRWYDSVGRLVKTDGSELAKLAYDRLGRQTHRFVLAVDDDTGYADADDVTGDIVLEEHQTVYDTESDEVLMRVSIARHHDDRDVGETTGALDSNADGDDLLLTAANVAGRPQITAYWYDRFGRLEDEVRYGTNGGSNFDRDGLSVPARSDTALRTTYTYDTAGDRQKVTDPKGIVAFFEYDAASRTTKEVSNYDANVNGGNPSGTDDNITVRYEYTDGLQTKIVADKPSGQTDQETVYTYGTTKGTSAGDSKIGTGHLLQKVAYPDSSGPTDVVTFAYNAQSQEVYKKDQAGNVFETDYDDSGRRTQTRVTTLASGFDGAVRRIETTFTDLGQVELVTSYDNASVGSGTVVDEVKHTYDGWGGLTKYQQDRNSAVGASGSVDDYEVSYTYEKATAGRNTIRRTGATLPSGNVITYEYSDRNGLHDKDTSRVTGLLDGAVTLVSYAYNGAGQVVGTDYPQPDVMWEMFGSTSGSYPDLDRFNRVTSSRWTADIATDVDFYDVDITYDRNSNITRVVDNVHSGFDVAYSIDDTDRLTQATEGTWNGSSITSKTRDQVWTLDHVGNWDHAKLDLDGDGSFTGADEYDDDRTHNAVNELTARDTDDDGTDDFTLTYDAVGNLTDDGESYTYEWDPFGRMRKVKNRSTSALVAEYRYNGLGHMIAVHEDTDRDGDVDGDDVWFYRAYDERWREIANFREDDTDPKEEFVPHQAGRDGLGRSSYINGVVLRDKDADTTWTEASDGVLEERIYYCQNWRGDVSTLVTSGRQMLEWVKYLSYGVPFGLPAGDADSDGDCDNTDVAQIQSWSNSQTYDVRGDIDLDGDVDGTDVTLAQSSVLGFDVLSLQGNRAGFAGMAHSEASGLALARHRWRSPDLGRWLHRDPLGYVDGTNLYEYVLSGPITAVDPSGQQGVAGGGWSAAIAKMKERQEKDPGGLGDPYFYSGDALQYYIANPAEELTTGGTDSSAPVESRGYGGIGREAKVECTDGSGAGYNLKCGWRGSYGPIGCGPAGCFFLNITVRCKVYKDGQELALDREAAEAWHGGPTTGGPPSEWRTEWEGEMGTDIDHTVDMKLTGADGNSASGGCHFSCPECKL